MKILKAKLHADSAQGDGSAKNPALKGAEKQGRQGSAEMQDRQDLIIFARDLISKAAKLGYSGLELSLDQGFFSENEWALLQKYADKHNLTLLTSAETVEEMEELRESGAEEATGTQGMPRNGDPAEEKSRLKMMEALRSQGKQITKKGMAVKEINKILTEIEDSKKNQKIIYFSHLQYHKVVDSKGQAVGKLKDLVIFGGEKFPEVTHFAIPKGNTLLLIPWKHVIALDKKLLLDSPLNSISTREVKDDDVLLGENILDLQVVDINGLKVIRVNDIALTYLKGKLAVVSIDVGARALFRRLGFEPFVNLLGINVKDRPVPWDSVEPLTGSIEKIHLKVPCPRVSDLPPTDVAELFDELSIQERHTMLKSMNSQTVANVLLECDKEIRQSILKSLKVKRIIGILDRLNYSEAATILADYPGGSGNEEVSLILKKMDKDKAVKIEEMLSYKKGTVARHMSTGFVIMPAEYTVEDAIKRLRQIEKHPANFYYVYVQDENAGLVGVISIKNLLIAAPDKPLREIMVSKLVAVEMGHPIEYAKELLTKHDLMALPIIDVQGRMKGIIDIADILDVAIHRAEEAKPFELTDEQKSTLVRHSRLKKYYGGIVKDMERFVRELDSVKPRKQDYVNHMQLKTYFDKDLKR